MYERYTIGMFSLKSVNLFLKLQNNNWVPSIKENQRIYSPLKSTTLVKYQSKALKNLKIDLSSLLLHQ
jgi:hypothetical protein